MAEERAGADSQQPQATGVLFMSTQQVQPEFTSVQRQSQYAWIISQHLLSPLVQVKQTPLSVVSHLQWPMENAQLQTIMPLCMTQQLHRPPVSMAQRFCIMLQAMASSQAQVSFMPPLHFSNFIVQRGTITKFGLVGVAGTVPMPGAPMPGTPIPGMPIPVRSIIIVLFIRQTPWLPTANDPCVASSLEAAARPSGR